MDEKQIRQNWESFLLQCVGMFFVSLAKVALSQLDPAHKTAIVMKYVTLSETTLLCGKFHKIV